MEFQLQVLTIGNGGFSVSARPQDTVMDLKMKIESLKGKEVYPAEHTLLVHKGKFLEDDTTLEENEISKSGFVVIMMTKALSAKSVPSSTSIPIASTPVAPTGTLAQAPTSVPTPTKMSAPAPVVPMSRTDKIAHGQAESNVVAGISALHIDANYSDSGLPEQTSSTLVAHTPPSGQAADAPAQAPQASQAADAPAQAPQASQAAGPSSGPNTRPLHLFPQDQPNVGSNAGDGRPFSILRNIPEVMALRGLGRTNSRSLLRRVEELGERNPEILRLLMENHEDFLLLTDERVERDEANVQSQLLAVGQFRITREQIQAIDRLVALGFKRRRVVEVFFACNLNEEMAVNYLWEHSYDD